MEKNQGVVFGQPWENGIGMRFAPLGQDLMVSIWETRVRDYELFRQGIRPHRAAGRRISRRTPDHPVVNVSREDAQAFCEWLTERERKDERIAADPRLSPAHRPRMEPDGRACEEEKGSARAGAMPANSAVYPVGRRPGRPTEKVGNFADMAAARTPGVCRSTGRLPAMTTASPSPRRSARFPPNALGIFDLSGNVQEWVEDEYSKLGNNVLGVLRGGGWNTYQTENLFTGSRNAVPPDFQDAIYGFRVVLAKVPPKAE